MKRICGNPSMIFTGLKRVHLQMKVAVAFLIIVVSCLQATAIPAQTEPSPADKTGSAATKIEEISENANSTSKSSGEVMNTISLKLEQCRTASDEIRAQIIPDKPEKTHKITDVRLPKSIKPVKYLIRLQPFINGNYSIAGYTEITFEALEATKNVTLHIADIITKNDTITLKPIDDLSGKGIVITEHRYDKDREFYIAILGQDLVAGTQYVLTVQFEGLLNDNLVGFYRSQYKDPHGNTRWLAATQFQPTDARRAFPCFDEPALKAKFEVFLARQTNMSAISNMPKIETTPIDGQPGWVWDHFNTTVPMSTYLVAFAISDFTSINSSSTNGVLFRVWAREQAIDQAEYSNRIGPDILTYFEKYFDLPYPLPKQDMIALPDFAAGAMENWGLITYRESALLYDPAVSSTSNKQWVAAVISHELAHQWFGDIVTPSWWTDLWLNEGFASYLQNLGVDAVHPTWKMIEQFVVSDLQFVFRLDCLESSHPISIPVGHPDEIGQIFDSISYDKGASIIRMMNHFLSESTLRKGLTNYLKHFEYDSAEQDDLWRFLTEQAHRDGSLPSNLTVKTIMDTWTLQMGYPVINVTFKGDGTASISQERFLMLKNPNSTDKHEYKWWVPISFTTEDNPDFNNTSPRVWMSSSESTKTFNGLPSPDKWTILNTQQTGYYRVNYDIDNWKLIIKQLKSDHKKIGVINRAQVVDDALNLARAGVLGYDVALDVISYLSKETEYVPWKATLNNLVYLKHTLIRTAAYGPFKRYLLSLLVPLYNSVGFTDNFNDPHLDQRKRVEAVYWACSLDHEDCVKNSVELFKQWMENPANNSIISPDQKRTVFCTAIKEGGEKEWNFAWQQYKESNVAGEKSILLRSLGCTKETWILSKYMDIAFTADSGVRKQDASTVFSAVAGNEVGRDQAWNFLRARLPDIVGYYGSSGMSPVGTLVNSVSEKFSTSFLKEELIRFRDENSDRLTQARRKVDQSIERTGNNEAWLSAHYPVIVKWLRDNGFDNTI